MSKKRADIKQTPPDAPAGSEYVLVRTREGAHWRKKRGTVKPAPINEVMKTSARAMTEASPAANAIRRKLHEFVSRLDMGRYTANVSAKLRKTLQEDGKLDYSRLYEYEFQPYNHLGALLRSQYRVSDSQGELFIHIEITGDGVRALYRGISDYYFELILLSGDPSEPQSLRVQSEASQLYPIRAVVKSGCKLSVDLPKKGPWMAMLKLNSQEGKTMAYHPRHYGMKVVAVGEGFQPLDPSVARKLAMKTPLFFPTK